MQGTYTPWLVCLSIAVAIVVSYTALSLASRVANARGTAAIAWITGGAVVMGVGIWSMHFIGMLALSLPIRLTYSLPITVTSLGIAIAISAFALRVASDPTLDWRRLTVSAVLLGAGIASMHYTGMAGIRIVPALSYEPLPFAASIGIAMSASYAALWLFFALRRGRSWQMLLARVTAAVIMGLAISGMHYTGMAAADFICTVDPTLVPQGFGYINPAQLPAIVAFVALTTAAMIVVYQLYEDSAQDVEGWEAATGFR